MNFHHWNAPRSHVQIKKYSTTSSPGTSLGLLLATLPPLSLPEAHISDICPHRWVLPAQVVLRRWCVGAQRWLGRRATVRSFMGQAVWRGRLREPSPAVLPVRPASELLLSFPGVIAPMCISEDGLWLLRLQELLEDGQMDQFHKALIELNMDSPEELQSYIQKLSAAVEQAKQKILKAEVSLEVDVVDSKPEVLGGRSPGVVREDSPFWGQRNAQERLMTNGLWPD